MELSFSTFFESAHVDRLITQAFDQLRASSSPGDRATVQRLLALNDDELAGVVQDVSSRVGLTSSVNDVVGLLRGERSMGKPAVTADTLGRAVDDEAKYAPGVPEDAKMRRWGRYFDTLYPGQGQQMASKVSDRLRTSVVPKSIMPSGTIGMAATQRQGGGDFSEDAIRQIVQNYIKSNPSQTSGSLNALGLDVAPRLQRMLDSGTLPSFNSTKDAVLYGPRGVSFFKDRAGRWNWSYKA